MLLLSAFLVGIVSGLRTFTPPAVVSWFARSGSLSVASSPLAFMGYRFTPIILTALALFELVMDKLPNTPSRKTPPQFIARIFSGGLTGATIGASGEALTAGMLLGVVGAVAGTFGGAAVRAKLAAAFGRDLPAALLEDLMAIGLAIIFLLRVR
jgi:uncharacterized membrane protein